MKKILFIVGGLFAALMLFYGGVAALVNQGHGLGQSLFTFAAVIAGGVGLVWLARSDR